MIMGMASVPRPAHAPLVAPSKKEVVPGLGQRIRAMRLGANLTQDHLASASGIKIETISRIENAATTPDLETLVRIGNALRVQLAELLPPPGDVEDDPELDSLVRDLKRLRMEDRALVRLLLGRLIG
jgi:transcriptional regulator with XRE-family HTH domain